MFILGCRFGYMFVFFVLCDLVAALIIVWHAILGVGVTCFTLRSVSFGSGLALVSFALYVYVCISSVSSCVFCWLGILVLCFHLV